MNATKPDLDGDGELEAFIDAFYERVLADPLLAPLFLEVAAIDVDQHLGVIKSYWRKMLFRETDYQRNMMAHHEALHGLHYLGEAHFERWLHLYRTTLAEGWHGPVAERADYLAVNIAGHMRNWLHTDDGLRRSRRRIEGDLPNPLDDAESH
jgi:hemoglobin